MRAGSRDKSKTGGVNNEGRDKDYLIKRMAKAQQNSAKAAAKKRIVKVDVYGDAHIVASFNNIIISLTNKNGQVIS